MIEVRHVRQNPNEHFRRWFSNENSDLIVWYSLDKTIEGFELSYDKAGQEKVVRWLSGKGFSHYSVDSGEQSPLLNRAPMLRTITGKLDVESILSCFEASATDLPADLIRFVQSKLGEYGASEFPKDLGPN